MIEAARITGRTDWRMAGLDSLAFIAAQQRSSTGKFRAIGSESFHKAYESLPFDQQPLEAWAAIDAAAVQQGDVLYELYCSVCHGFFAIGPKTRPDLRFSDYLDNGDWNSVLIDGALSSNGMASFGKQMSPAEADAIRQYVISLSQKNVATPTVVLPHQ